jgi:hypothetical protein
VSTILNIRCFVFAGFFSLALLGCGKPDNPNDYPVGHWLNDSDDCVRASVAAITKSGLPFPHFGTVETPLVASGAAPERRIKTVDMWLGPTRFVIPAQVASSNGAYPEHHPRRYEGLRGSLPNFYPPGPPGPDVDGMGSMVDVTFKCSMDEKYTASWGKGYRSNAEGIEKAKAQYERRLREGPEYTGEVTVNRRDDIGMMEVLMDRRREANGQRYWEASYWPIDGELRGPSGNVSGIVCDNRHDPIERRYGGRGWRCGASLRLTPHGAAQLEVYVSHIQQMPAVFEQVKQLLVSAQQPQKE